MSSSPRLRSLFIASLCIAGLAIAANAAPAQENDSSAAQAIPFDKTSTPDTSLSPEKYKELGVPDPAKPWSPQELSAAVEALTRIANVEYKGLPRYQSPNSAALFARLTSPDNFNACKDKNTPITDRMTLSLSVYSSINTAASLYSKASRANSVSTTDLLELLNIEIQSYAVLFDNIEELETTLNPDDPTSAARIKTFELSKIALTQAFIGILAVPMSHENFNTQDIKRLLASTQKTMALLYPRLMDESRPLILRRLNTLKKSSTFAHLNPELTAFVDAILAQDKTKPAPK